MKDTLHTWVIPDPIYDRKIKAHLGPWWKFNQYLRKNHFCRDISDCFVTNLYKGCFALTPVEDEEFEEIEGPWFHLWLPFYSEDTFTRGVLGHELDHLKIEVLRFTGVIGQEDDFSSEAVTYYGEHLFKEIESRFSKHTCNQSLKDYPVGISKKRKSRVTRKHIA